MMRSPRPQLKSKLHYIKADLLIPGRGEPIQDAAVVIDGSQIAWVGETKSLPSEYKSLPYVSLPVVMPGLWDCHVHMFGGGLLDRSMLEVPPALAGARVARDAEKLLMAGYTSVREVGGYGGTIAPGIKDGYLTGPNIYSSMSVLSTTGGHGDSHNTPLPYMLDAENNGLPMTLCDGVDGCTRAVRLQLRKGARLIKICATGGVMSLLDDPQHRQFSDEELKAMIEEAGRAKRVVAAHCHGKDGIIAALKAGVKTIEHGSYLDQEVIDLMKEKDAILVATRTVSEVGLTMEKYIDPISYKKLVALAGIGKDAYKLAIKQGVKIALGTDIGESDDISPLRHGTNGKEPAYAVECGMTPLEAIEATTATSPETLGGPDFQSPLSGQLKPGYDADIIALSDNPLDDINILSKPKNITHVWKGGKLFKSPCCGLIQEDVEVEIEEEVEGEEKWGESVRRRGFAFRTFF